MSSDELRRCAMESQPPSSTRAPRRARAATIVVPIARRASTMSAPSNQMRSRMARPLRRGVVAVAAGVVVESVTALAGSLGLGGGEETALTGEWGPTLASLVRDGSGAG